ncbi:DNA-binding transcriptional regulator, MarR family [Friedmanniella luteola]|uniref:DNA-binding transcriptional regulator, MarR family n=1 Tax=Friedmanniella luteola TaxID=546871 RepID=A0A1H1SV28_9ACTN|nr:MarR family transcriptional regulator [Friedmanniella luteola]SDS51683.1 DNA-binding transcriptional regulator, MarR family [Friedmanniella luteola]
MASAARPGNPSWERAAGPARPDEQSAPSTHVVRLAIALVRQAAVLGTHLAEQTGLHTTDVRALQVLDLAATAGGISMGELARQLSITPQAASALLDRLEARDLARREPYPGDRRRTQVILGPAAQAFGQQHLAPLATRLQAAAAELTHAEADAVQKFLGKVVDAEQAQAPHPGREQPQGEHRAAGLPTDAVP